MRGEYANDDGLEILEPLAWNQTLFDFQLSGEQTAQGVTLVDGERSNDAARIRDGFEPLTLAWRQSHSDPPAGNHWQPAGFLAEKRGEPASAPLLIPIVCVSAD